MHKSYLDIPAIRRLPLMMLTVLFASACLLQSGLTPAVEPPGKIADDQLFSYVGKDPLPPGTLPWQLLRQVTLAGANQKGPKAAAMLPVFSPQIKAFDQKEVKIYGFVLPLSTSQKQSHFLISPLPTHCPFCVNQGPDSMVEVVTRNPVDYSPWEPIVISGRLELVNDQYLFYRLTNAELVKF